MSRTGAGLAVLAAAALIGLAAVGPIRQDPSYHRFADRRSLVGIPHFWNVVSNLPFAIAGGLGLVAVRRARAGWERRAWQVLFASIGLTAVGSAYYHAAPDDTTLFFDRLPMAVAFTALVAIVAGGRVERMRTLWLPLVAAGAGSVVYWRMTDDLRLYVVAQFASIGAVLLLALATHPRGARQLYFAIAWYGAAKAFEHFDGEIFRAASLLSGHTLKHLAEAVSAWWLVRMVQARTG